MRKSTHASIVNWIGRLGAAGADHVALRFGIEPHLAEASLGQLAHEGLLEQRRLLYRRAPLYVATEAGLRSQRLDYLKVFRMHSGGFEQAWEVASVAVALEQLLAGWRVLSEREIRAREANQRALFASVQVGRLPSGRPWLYSPDLALASPGDRVLAVKLELSPNPPLCLASICRGWAIASHVQRVYCFVSRRLTRPLERAIVDARAEHRVRILPLGESGVLAALEIANVADFIAQGSD